MRASNDRPFEKVASQEKRGGTIRGRVTVGGIVGVSIADGAKYLLCASIRPPKAACEQPTCHGCEEPRETKRKRKETCRTTRQVTHRKRHIGRCVALASFGVTHPPPSRCKVGSRGPVAGRHHSARAARAREGQVRDAAAGGGFQGQKDGCMAKHKPRAHGMLSGRTSIDTL